MTTASASSARPEPIALTPEEQAAIARVFEGGTTLFGALSTVRTRRIGLSVSSLRLLMSRPRGIYGLGNGCWRSAR